MIVWGIAFGEDEPVAIGVSVVSAWNAAVSLLGDPHDQLAKDGYRVVEYVITQKAVDERFGLEMLEIVSGLGDVCKSLERVRDGL